MISPRFVVPPLHSVCSGAHLSSAGADRYSQHGRRAHNLVTGETFWSYAIIGSIADRGTSTCSAPYESGSIAPWSKKNRIPSLSTAKFW